MEWESTMRMFLILLYQFWYRDIYDPYRPMDFIWSRSSITDWKKYQLLAALLNKLYQNYVIIYCDSSFL
jgi:hypothetical protein